MSDGSGDAGAVLKTDIQALLHKNLGVVLFLIFVLIGSMFWYFTSKISGSAEGSATKAAAAMGAAETKAEDAKGHAASAKASKDEAERIVEEMLKQGDGLIVALKKLGDEGVDVQRLTKSVEDFTLELRSASPQLTAAKNAATLASTKAGQSASAAAQATIEAKAATSAADVAATAAVTAKKNAETSADAAARAATNSKKASEALEAWRGARLMVETRPFRISKQNCKRNPKMGPEDRYCEVKFPSVEGRLITTTLGEVGGGGCVRTPVHMVNFRRDSATLSIGNITDVNFGCVGHILIFKNR